MDALYKIDGNRLIINDGVTDLYQTEFHRDTTCVKSEFLGIEEICFPESLKCIHRFAFCNFENLRKVEFPSSLLYIEDNAFNDCENLAEIKFTEGLQTIGNDAFNMCCNLTKIDLPNSLQSIGSGAFGQCFRLTDIKIPDNVTSIMHDAFYCCINLTHIKLPDNIKYLYPYLFRGCAHLTEVCLPKNLMVIGEGVFEDCSALKSIDIPDSVYSIKVGAFIRCTELREIRLPDKLNMIQEGVFQQCTSLNVYINNKLNFIDSYAFCGCENVTVKIPANTNIHVTKDSFKNSINMTLEIGNRKGSWEKLSPNYTKSLYPIQFLIDPTYDNFIKIKDIDIKIKYALKYNSLDKRFDTYLKKYPEKVLDCAIKEENIEAVDYIIDNKFISEKKIDKCLDFAREGNFSEIFAMLVKYKEEIGGYEKDNSGRFEL